MSRLAKFTLKSKSKDIYQDARNSAIEKAIELESSHTIFFEHIKSYFGSDDELNKYDKVTIYDDNGYNLINYFKCNNIGRRKTTSSISDIENYAYVLNYYEILPEKFHKMPKHFKKQILETFAMAINNYNIRIYVDFIPYIKH